MKVEIGIVVQHQPAGHALRVAPILHGLHRDGFMGQLRGPLVGKNAVLQHRWDVHHWHDALEFSDARVHVYVESTRLAQRSEPFEGGVFDRGFVEAHAVIRNKPELAGMPE